MSGGLHELARQTGRYPDSHLVHMSTNELNALQSLAVAKGGSLTTNPTTGLPEAGFLDNLLPTILGVGLSFIPGVGPLAAAGLVGAGYGIAEGDLGKGLMAGLGAFGGASLAGSLSNLGGKAAADAAGNNLVQEHVANTLAGSGVGSGATTGVANGIAQQVAPNAMHASLANSGLNAAQQTAAQQMINQQAVHSLGGLTANQAVANQVIPNTLSNFGRGLQGLPGNLKNLPAAWQATTGGGLKSMAGLAGLAVPFLNTDPTEMNVPKEDTPKYEGPYMPAHRAYRPNTRALTPENSSEWQYFDVVNPVPNTVPFKQYASGGQVSDGVSDSVPANIDGKQPAALSQGEFVVPARVVAEIGNGSSDAGAAKLARMLAKVEAKARSARRGKPSGADVVAAQTMGAV